MRKPFSRKAAYAGVALAMAFAIGSSAYVYAFYADYFNVFNDSNLKVDLRIESINTNPQRQAIVVASIKIQNKSPSDITVLLFDVKVWNAPSQTRLYGADSRSSVLLHALDTRIIKQNSKVLDYQAFLADLKGTSPTDVDHDGKVFVLVHIQWTHFGQTYERLNGVYLDVSAFSWVL